MSSNSLLRFFSIQATNSADFATEKIDIIVYVLIGALSVDTVINVTSTVLGISVSSPVGVTLFVILGVTTVICQSFILQFIGKISHSIRQRSRLLRSMHITIMVSQHTLIVIFIYVMCEIALTGSYSPIFSIVTTSLSYMLTASLMVIFTIIYLSWYVSDRTSALVLVYGLSFATVVISSLAILTVWIHVFVEQMPTQITRTSDVYYLRTEKGSSWKIFSNIYQYVDIVSFLLKWGGTVLMLYHYSSKIGKTRFWFLLSLPLAYFSTVIIYHFHIYEPHGELESLIFLGITSLNSTFGGILFYLGFRITSEQFKKNKVFRYYLIMAGFGFMLFFAATQSSLITTVYPPFGFSTVSSYGLGSYLILLGLYLSASSVSRDEQVWNMVKKSTLSEAKFLASIGTSAEEREKELVNSVLEKAKLKQEEIAKDSGIGTSLTDEDIKHYVEDVEDGKAEG